MPCGASASWSRASRTMSCAEGGSGGDDVGVVGQPGDRATTARSTARDLRRRRGSGADLAGRARRPRDEPPGARRHEPRLERPARSSRHRCAARDPRAVPEQDDTPADAVPILVDLELDLGSRILSAQLQLGRARLGALARDPDAVLGERRRRERKRRPDDSRHRDSNHPCAHLVSLPRLDRSTPRRVPPGGSRPQWDLGRRPHATWMRHPVAQFAVAGLAVLAVFGAAALLALRGLGNAEALRDARQFATLAGQGIVEPTVAAGLLRGEPEAIAAVDRIVQERVLGERVVRVKLWARDGRVVYSDEPRLIGARFPLEAEKLDVLRSGATNASLTDVSGPENRYERGQGDLYEVYLPIRAPDGTPLLFETYQRRSAVASTGRRIWMPFAALMLGSLVLLWLVQVPLAWRLDRRLRRSQAEREALLVRAVEASDDERRRIAADLHDGPVQHLAGISYSLSAAAQTEGSTVARETLQHAAAGTPDSMRRLRSLLVEIHPPNLRASGLEAALVDLLAP